MNKAFSKIWIIVVLVILITGGVIVYRYWWMSITEIPGAPHCHEIEEIKVKSLNLKGYKLYKCIRMCLPVEACTSIYAVKRGSSTLIHSVSDLSNIVSKVKNENQALEFAKILSNNHWHISDFPCWEITEPEFNWYIEHLIWPEKIREKYSPDYPSILEEKLAKLQLKPNDAMIFHKITFGEILSVTKKENCTYVLDISPIEKINIPSSKIEIKLFHPNQLNYIGNCHEVFNKNEKIIAFSIMYEKNNTFYSPTIYIEKLNQTYEESADVSLPKFKEVETGKKGNNFVIRRYLACHGHPDKIIVSEEEITETGNYIFSIKEVIIEGMNMFLRPR